MADVDVVVNELLCLMTNYFGKVAKTNITTTVVGFYEEEELVAAKSAIYELNRISHRTVFHAIAFGKLATTRNVYTVKTSMQYWSSLTSSRLLYQNMWR